MRGGERAAGSRPSLDKPLEELTDEDIFQLTREDCRRYLKEKGMRRPSWNKSQAIQQVLSLKSLFESKPDQESKKPSKHKPATPLHETATESTSAQPPFLKEQFLEVSWRKEVLSKGTSEKQRLYSDVQEAYWIPSLGNKPPQPITEGKLCTHDDYGPKSAQPLLGLPTDFKNDYSDRLCSHTSESLSRSDSFQQPTAQLTIFYAGMVNVYDDVPTDKAQAIVRLAGIGNNIPIPLPPRVSNGFAGPTGYQDPIYARNSTAYVPRPGIAVPDALVFPIASGTHSELPKSRKACVQRFLKKRKERARLKSACATSKAPLFDRYLQNPQLNLPRHSDNRSFHSSLFGRHHQQQHYYSFNQKRCTQSSGSETSSPTRPPQTPRRSSSSHDNDKDEHHNEGDNLNTCSEDKCFEATSE